VYLLYFGVEFPSVNLQKPTIKFVARYLICENKLCQLVSKFFKYYMNDDVCNWVNLVFNLSCFTLSYIFISRLYLYFYCPSPGDEIKFIIYHAAAVCQYVASLLLEREHAKITWHLPNN
jgi:hypothetical protein